MDSNQPIQIIPVSKLDHDSRLHAIMTSKAGVDPLTGAYLYSPLFVAGWLVYTAKYESHTVNFTADNDLQACEIANRKLNSLLSLPPQE